MGNNAAPHSAGEDIQTSGTRDKAIIAELQQRCVPKALREAQEADGENIAPAPVAARYGEEKQPQSIYRKVDQPRPIQAQLPTPVSMSNSMPILGVVPGSSVAVAPQSSLPFPGLSTPMGSSVVAAPQSNVGFAPRSLSARCSRPALVTQQVSVLPRSESSFVTCGQPRMQQGSLTIPSPITLAARTEHQVRSHSAAPVAAPTFAPRVLSPRLGYNDVKPTQLSGMLGSTGVSVVAPAAVPSIAPVATSSLLAPSYLPPAIGPTTALSAPVGLCGSITSQVASTTAPVSSVPASYSIPVVESWATTSSAPPAISSLAAPSYAPTPAPPSQPIVPSLVGSMSTPSYAPATVASLKTPSYVPTPAYPSYTPVTVGAFKTPSYVPTPAVPNQAFVVPAAVGSTPSYAPATVTSMATTSYTPTPAFPNSLVLPSSSAPSYTPAPVSLPSSNSFVQTTEQTQASSGVHIQTLGGSLRSLPGQTSSNPPPRSSSIQRAQTGSANILTSSMKVGSATIRTDPLGSSLHRLASGSLPTARQRSDSWHIAPSSNGRASLFGISTGSLMAPPTGATSHQILTPRSLETPTRQVSLTPQRMVTPTPVQAATPLNIVDQRNVNQEVLGDRAQSVFSRIQELEAELSRLKNFTFLPEMSPTTNTRMLIR